MDGPLLLPALRGERGGIVLVDRIATMLAGLGVAWTLGTMMLSTEPFELAAMGFLTTVLLAPAWIHIRVWPRLAYLAMDRPRRDDLFLAGLAEVEHLWAAISGPALRAMLLPVATALAMLILSVSTTVFIIFPNPFTLAYIMLTFVPPLAAVVCLSLAGAADVFARLCRGMTLAGGIMVSLGWAAFATGLTPWLFFRAESDHGTPSGAPVIWFVATGAFLMMLIRMYRESEQGPDDESCAARTGFKHLEEKGRRGPGLSRPAAICLAAEYVFIVVLMYLSAVTVPMPDYVRAIGGLLEVFIVAVMAYLLLVNRVRRAVRDYRNGVG